MRTFHALMLIACAVFLPFSGLSQGVTGSRTAVPFESFLLPVPQKVAFSEQYFPFDGTWTIEQGKNVPADDPAVVSLVTALKERVDLPANSKTAGRSKASSKVIRLTVKSEAVPIGEAAQTDKSALMEQAYALNLSPALISITANGPAGLFYGVQTLLQLLKSQGEQPVLPTGDVTDWPDLGLRIIYWDDAHHLDRMETMKNAIRQAAYFKINGLALKLEGHFDYPSAKPIVEPYAYSPAEYQELTDYALAHYVQLIPYLDAPAHVSFILKHPEYAHLRGYPDSNYQFSVVNPGTEKLLTGMFDDLLAANKGGKYFLLSTDEAYYTGKPENEKDAAKALGSNGKLLASFVTTLSDKLHAKGRDVIIWAEYPLASSDIEALPSHLINGVYNKEWAPKIKEKGIRQLIYTSTQGVELLFPTYYPLRRAQTDTGNLNDDQIQQGNLSRGRVANLIRSISSAIDNNNSIAIGTIVAAWADSGLHPETFWLGYTTGTATAWNYKPASAEDLSARFYNSFYSPSAYKMEKVYQLLSNQAQYYEDSWDWVDSQLRSPILGNHREIFATPQPARDQTLPSLPVPSATDFSLNKDWSTENKQRLHLAEQFLKQNDELLDLLHKNLHDISAQPYNLKVLLSVAQLCRQNLDMILGLQRIDRLLKLSATTASASPAVAVSLIDEALDEAKRIRDERNETLLSVVSTWYQSWYPRVAEANGRRYVDEVDNIKDHLPVRTVDMSYLIYRQLHYRMGKWAEEVRNARNQYAAKHQLPSRTEIIEWESMELKK